VNASDGEITVQSAPGKGAEFTISFPRIAADQVILSGAKDLTGRGGAF
jgi:signal transduction histidine kinase